MNDQIIQIEVALNFLNTLFSKAVYFNDMTSINKLNDIRYDIYYGNLFNYDTCIKNLKYIEGLLNKYE
jgi:hypothetical protein